MTQQEKESPVKFPGIAFPVACRLLKNIDEAGFGRLCTCLNVRQRRFVHRETFIFEGDPCDRIGIVVSGSVRLTRQRLDGGCNVLEDVGVGDVFGMTYAFLGQGTMGINVSAVGETTVLLLGTERITQLCPRACPVHAQLVQNLLTVLSQKAYRLKQKLRILSQRTIRGRLMLFLQMTAKRANALAFDIPYDRQALADYLCVDRSALSAELSKLRSEGVLDSDRNHFVLKP